MNRMNVNALSLINCKCIFANEAQNLDFALHRQKFHKSILVRLRTTLVVSFIFSPAGLLLFGIQ